MNIIEITGLILICIGFIFIIFGTVALFRYKDFYARMLSSCIIDITGFLTIIIGIIFYKGKEIGVLKLIFLAVLYILLNSISSHVLARGAYLSGEYIKEEK